MTAMNITRFSTRKWDIVNIGLPCTHKIELRGRWGLLLKSMHRLN